MYGRLTRREEPWVPDRLLCLRFNVPDPYKDKPLPQTKNKSTNSQRRYQETVSILQGSQRRREKIQGPSRLSRTSVSALTQGKGISFVAKGVYNPQSNTSTGDSVATSKNISSSSITNTTSWQRASQQQIKNEQSKSSTRSFKSNKDSDDEDDNLGLLAAPTNKPEVDLFKAIFDGEDDDIDLSEESSDDDEDEEEKEEDDANDDSGMTVDKKVDLKKPDEPEKRQGEEQVQQVQELSLKKEVAHNVGPKPSEKPSSPNPVSVFVHSSDDSDSSEDTRSKKRKKKQHKE